MAPASSRRTAAGRDHTHHAPILLSTSLPDPGIEGVPSLTRRAVGQGAAYYLATFPDRDGIERLVDRLLAESAIEPVADADFGVELTRRRAADGSSFVFAINHSGADASVRRVAGTELLSGAPFTGTVSAGRVAVIAEQ